jgi:rSAM/selenodomain-associated transferase 2
MNPIVDEKQPAVSVIVPTLNEERTIGTVLEALTRMHNAGEIIVVDGGSSDRTIEIARKSGAKVVTSERGRGTQMHTGAQVARGQTLLFLHADTLAPVDTIVQINQALAADADILGGNFSIRFKGQSRPARLMTWLYPKLQRLGLSYGDAGIFVRANIYREIGGFNSFPLFEDLEFIKRLKRRGRMVHLPVELLTSSRRFEGRSFPLTFARWSMLQALYWLGVSPHILNKLYI